MSQDEPTVAKCDAVSSAVLALKITHADNPANIASVSGGVCSASVSRGESVDANALVERAEVLLYAAKCEVRNRFVADVETTVEGELCLFSTALRG
jgi:PleD family two-component response regulator